MKFLYEVQVVLADASDGVWAQFNIVATDFDRAVSKATELLDEGEEISSVTRKDRIGRV